jgi:hypothetical protein
MDANTYPLREILTQQRRYLIPTFQRDYEWTEDGQWELLYDDLEAVADRLEHARELALDRGESLVRAERDVAPHFLGAIVLDQLPSAAGGIDLRSVIDGQQRLTTLQLILRGLLDVLLIEASSRAEQVRALLENPDYVVREDDDRYKLWPRRHDRDAWRDVMSDDGTSDGTRTNRYAQARAYFATRTRTALDESSAERLDVLVDAALSLFKVVVIDLEDNDDAQIIFEVLNGRQTPLSATDLVKNLLFLRAELADESELENLYDLHWAPFDDDWWKKVVGRGHAARGRRDILLSSWLAAASMREPNVGRLYSETRNYVEETGRAIPDLLAELASYRRAYESVYGRSPARGRRVLTAYNRVDLLGVTTALPLLLWLETLSTELLSTDEHERAVMAIESWIVRRMITGAQTRGYAKVFVDVLAAAKEAPDGTTGAAVVQALLKLEDTMTWPSDQDVSDAFLGRRFYGQLAQERVRMLLGAIDEQLQGDQLKGEQASFDYTKLQIEHIMPQSWQQHWSLEVDELAARELAEQRRRAAVDRIGNLTLITAPLNQSVSNGPWQTKREGLRQHSQLILNSVVVDYDDWNEGRIDERARALSGVACRVWPRPAPVDSRIEGSGSSGESAP